MNKLVLIGRIANDLNLAKTNSGKSVLNFTLAVSRIPEGADFINCVIWDKQAENLAKYQSKGSLIAVYGNLKVDSYEKDGIKNFKTYVSVNEVEFLSSKKPEANQPKTENYGYEIEDDELPF